MAELRVPELVDNGFRDHYRELIRSSVERAEADQGRRRPTSSGRPAGRFGTSSRTAVRVLWLAALVLLLLDLAAFGIDSWMTSVADIGLIVLTLAWFWVCVDDLVASRATAADQLELFE